MSTKIWNGARCKKQDLALVLIMLRNIAQTKMKKDVGDIVKRLKIKTNDNGDEWIKYSDKIHKDWSNPEGGLFRRYFWAQVWLPEGSEYALFNLSDTFDKNQFSDVLTDYSYWNNVDQPANVSDVDWALRSLTWKQVLDDIDDEAGQLAIDFVRERDVWLEFYRITRGGNQ